MESNVPATVDEPAVPAAEDEPAVPATVAGASVPATVADEYAGGESHWAQRPRQRQNIATGVFPMALAALLLVFFVLAFWTLASGAGASP